MPEIDWATAEYQYHWTLGQQLTLLLGIIIVIIPMIPLFAYPGGGLGYCCGFMVIGWCLGGVISYLAVRSADHAREKGRREFEIEKGKNVFSCPACKCLESSETNWFDLPKEIRCAECDRRLLLERGNETLKVSIIKEDSSVEVIDDEQRSKKPQKELRPTKQQLPIDKDRAEKVEIVLGILEKKGYEGEKRTQEYSRLMSLTLGSLKQIESQER